MNNRPDTLIILTPGFPDSEADVNCLPMQQSFTKNLKKLNPDLNIIVLSFQYPYKTSTYQWHDITVMSFNGQNKGGLYKLLLRRKLNTVLKEIGSNHNILGLLSFWYGECALVGKRFADKYNIKHYCWILGQDAKKENKYPKQLLASSNELVALSDFLRDEFEKNHGPRLKHVIPPGIDITQFDSLPHPRNIDILGVGSLIPLKRFDFFISVIATLAKKYPTLKAVICGKGPEKNKLFNLISEAGLHSNIILMDETNHGEVLLLMQRSKILLHTSSYEGFANVYAEALYAGAHVVGFCKPMNRDFDHLHIVQDEDAMINKADAILSNEKIDFSPVLTYSMDDTCRKFFQVIFSQD